MTITDIDKRLEFDRADRMRKALRVSGLSVQQVADELEVYRNTVGSWINGHTTPRWRDLKAFAKLTGVEPEWLDPEMCARRDLNPRPIGLEPVGPSLSATGPCLACDGGGLIYNHRTREWVTCSRCNGNGWNSITRASLGLAA